jgi:UV DNA damage endonuclease
VSELALENAKALKALIHWNHEHGVRLFRVTSNIFPWCTEYDMTELNHFDEIADELAFCVKLARAYQQRLTFHPSHFVKLGVEDGQLLQRSLREMEVHSKIFDLMGYEPSHYNKINIHIGGVYGDKPLTLERFADNFKKLSPNCQKRMTVENDDWGSAFSVRDLLPMSQQTGIPIVFDFHHHKFCSGDWSEKEAFYAAIGTWPEGVRPIVHWSESQAGRRPSAHSDYIKGPMELHGKERDVDVMIEAKCKERTLLRFRAQMDGNLPPLTEVAEEIVNPNLCRR